MGQADHEEEDDWIFTTMDKYNHLLIYDLPSVPYKIKSVNRRSVLVATKTNQGKNELLLLDLPGKLLKVDKDEVARCKNRDFSISGGAHLPGELSDVAVSTESTGHRIFCSYKREKGVSVYRIGLEGELEKEPMFVDTLFTAPCTALDTIPSILAFAEEKTMRIFDLGSETPITEVSLASEVSRLKFASENTLIYCEEKSGSLTLFDTRSAQPVFTVPGSEGGSYTMDTHSGQTVRVSNIGDIAVFDFRKGLEPVKNFKVEGEATPTVSSFSDKFLVAGFNGNVEVFGDENKIFVHEGHSRNSDVDGVRSQCGDWHGVSGLIFSGASDGSIHIWEPEI